MKKFIIIIVFVTSSCSKDFLFDRDQVLISKEIKEIVILDQVVRKYNNSVNYKFSIRDFSYINDSLRKAGIEGNLNNFFDFSKLPSVKLQVSKMNNELREKYYKEIKDNEIFMSYIDRTNADRIYKIIKKYGYPSFNNRKWSDTVNVRIGATFILTHSLPSSYIGSKTLKLMIKEYKKGRVDVGEMKHYLWHVDGRNLNDPFGENLDVEKWIKSRN